MAVYMGWFVIGVVFAAILLRYTRGDAIPVRDEPTVDQALTIVLTIVLWPVMLFGGVIVGGIYLVTQGAIWLSRRIP